MQISSKWIAGLASLSVAAAGLAGSALTRDQSSQVTADADSRGGHAVRINQLQQIGAHNAYHRELPDDEKKIQLAQDPGAAGLFYSHASIPDQLEDQNIRMVEPRPVPGPAGRALHASADPEDGR